MNLQVDLEDTFERISRDLFPLELNCSLRIIFVRRNYADPQKAKSLKSGKVECQQIFKLSFWALKRLRAIEKLQMVTYKLSLISSLIIHSISARCGITEIGRSSVYLPQFPLRDIQFHCTFAVRISISSDSRSIPGFDVFFARKRI